MLSRQAEPGGNQQRAEIVPVQAGGDFSNESAEGASSADLGATGGNLGNLDGSITWRSIKKMKLRRGSQQWGPDGCWAMW